MLRGSDTGALERRNPLPRGVYWADFYDPPQGGASINAIALWLTEHRESVRVRNTVYHGPGKDPLKAFVEGSWTLTPALAALAGMLPDSGRAREWLLFEVLQSVEWPAVQFGYPTLADIKTTEEDTVQKPDPEPEGFDWLGKQLPSSESTALVLGGVAAVVVIALVLKS
jgi:hypothetical protein